jgi:apolipoprotein N-acyltransferase
VELVVAVMLARRAVVQWRHWLSIFVYPALTAGFDMLESSFSGHGSAASFAQSQMNAIAVIQIAALAGTSGVVFTVNLFASTLAVAWYQGSGWGQFRTGYTVAGLLVFGALAFGVIVSSPHRANGGFRLDWSWSTHRSKFKPTRSTQRPAPHTKALSTTWPDAVHASWCCPKRSLL